MMKIPKKLGELLVENKILTESQLLEALENQKKTRRLLGEIIVALGFTTREKLDTALARQYGSKLGEILISKNLITFERLQSVMFEHKNALRALGEILVDRGCITENNLMICLSEQYNLPYIHLSDYNINPEAVAKIPLDALRKHAVFPIDIQNNMLVVATSNPDNCIAEEDLRFLSGMYIKYVLSSKSEILGYIE